MFALLKELKDGGYVDKNDFGGTYDNETLIWQVGRFDTAQPGNDIITYKAICLNAKAINEIFQDLTKLPRPVPAYALYDPKHDETLLLFKEKATTQVSPEPKTSSETNEKPTLIPTVPMQMQQRMLGIHLRQRNQMNRNNGGKQITQM